MEAGICVKQLQPNFHGLLFVWLLRPVMEKVIMLLFCFNLCIHFLSMSRLIYYSFFFFTTVPVLNTLSLGVWFEEWKYLKNWLKEDWQVGWYWNGKGYGLDLWLQRNRVQLLTHSPCLTRKCNVLLCSTIEHPTNHPSTQEHNKKASEAAPINISN